MNKKQEEFFENAKTYYLYDENGKYMKSKIVYDDTIPSNATTVEPFKLVGGVKVLMTNPTFDISKQSWIESEVIPQPSTTQQMISQLALQQAQFQVTQQKLNSQLALQVAQLTAKGVK